MSRFTRFLLMTFAFSMGVQLHAQYINGLVRDAENEETLVGVQVYGPKMKIGTVTDDDGKFSLGPIDTSIHYIYVRYLGYALKKIPIQSLKGSAQPDIDHSLNIIRLVTTDRMINPVTIIGGSPQEKLRSTSSIQSVQPYLLKNKVLVSVEDAMKQVPGLNTADGQVNIRAGSGWSFGTGSRVSVVVDGMPMMNAGTGQIMWSLVPVENVKQVEILKGASSVLYGSSALNGVINIRTQMPEPGRNSELISASVFSGVYDKPRQIQPWTNRVLMRNGAHARYGRHLEKYNFDYVVSTFINLDDSYRMGDQDKWGRLSFKTRYRSEDKKWTMGLNGNGLYGRTGSFLLWEDYEHAYTTLDSQFAYNSAKRLNLDPYLTFANTSWKHELRGRVLLVENNIDQLSTEPDQNNRSDLYYLEYRVHPFRINKRVQYHFGAVGQYGNSRASMFMGQKTNANVAGYVQVDYSDEDRLDISAGARYEYYRLDSYTEGKPVFKLGANYRFAKASFIRASFGQGYRFPMVSEAFIQTSAGPVSILPNPDLRSEFGYNMELGFRQVIPIGDIKILADLAAYSMYYDQMMEFSFSQWTQPLPPTFGAGFKAVNIGPSRIDGIEISLSGNGRIGETEWLLLAGYNYAVPQNLDPNYAYAENFVQAPLTYASTSTDTTGTILKYRQQHLVKFDLQMDYKRWQAGVSYRFQSQMQAIDNAFVQFPISAFVPGVQDSREANAGGDHIVDLRLAYHLSSKWRVTFAIDNLMNEEYLNRPSDMAAPRTFTTQISFSY